MNAIADKAINANKKQDSVADKKLNIATDKAINTKKRQDTTSESLMLIKDQIIR